MTCITGTDGGTTDTRGQTVADMVSEFASAVDLGHIPGAVIMAKDLTGTSFIWFKYTRTGELNTTYQNLADWQVFSWRRH